MSRIVRQSKYRHVFAEPDKTDNAYAGLELSSRTTDGYYVSASTKFFAVALRGGGGKTLVLPFEQHGKVPRGQPCIQGHSGDVIDLAFNPFNDNILATGATDCTVKLWSIPDGGLTEPLKEAVTTLNGHPKDVTLLQWHPTASNVLASAGRDMAVRIWDVEHAADKLVVSDCFGGLISDMRFNYFGSLLATSSKDKMVRVFDPRTDAKTPISEVQAHEGAKVVNTTFTGRDDRLITAGFNRTSRREFKVWDPRNMSAPVAMQALDQAAGVLMPFYDPDSNILFLGGKGDGNIRYFEFVEEGDDLNIYPITEYKSSESAKGLTMLPKRSVDVGRCETARFIKLTRDKASVISFIVPRKSDRFQEDIYPDTVAPTPATTADAWFGGANPEPKLMSMDPDKNGGMTTASATVTVKATGKTKEEVTGAATGSASASSSSSSSAASGSGDGGVSAEEASAMRARIAELESELAAAKKQVADAEAAKARAEDEAKAATAAAAASSSGADSGDSSELAEELARTKEENEDLKAQVAKLKKTVATLME